MATLEMIDLYPSPYSERLRWVLEAKSLPYQRRSYQPLADEDELRRTTGQATVPVLLADGEIVGDSNVAVDWLEERHPATRLLPADPAQRAEVRAWELAATEGLAPSARLVSIGRWKAMDMQPFADHFAAKYGWSPAVEAAAGHVVDAFTSDLAQAVSRSPYLVGDGFTRADLTVACMLATVLGHPADELFTLDAGMRALFGLPQAESLAPLARWRDELYRRHRGGRVVPAS